jgi:hypothetical protein
MRRVLYLVAAVGLAVPGAGCQKEEFEYYDFGPDVAAETAEDVVPEITEVTEVAEVDGEGVAIPPPGAPCAKDEDCATGLCLTTEDLAGIGLAAPGGMCTKTGCATDDECGEGGVCVEGLRFGAFSTTLCLLRCADTRTCRFSSGYGCFDVGVVDADQKPILACAPSWPAPAAPKAEGAACDANHECATGLCQVETGKGRVCAAASVLAGKIATGGACGENKEKETDCFTGSCLNTTDALVLDPRIVVPDAMCWSMACAVDADCGPAAACVDATKIVKDAPPLMLCLARCDSSAQCRHDEGFGCVDTTLKDEDEKPILACIPSSLILILTCTEAEACVCPDQTCDATEKAAGACPEDCK